MPTSLPLPSHAVTVQQSFPHSQGCDGLHIFLEFLCLLSHLDKPLLTSMIILTLPTAPNLIGTPEGVCPFYSYHVNLGEGCFEWLVVQSVCLHWLSRPSHRRTVNGPNSVASPPARGSNKHRGQEQWCVRCGPDVFSPDKLPMNLFCMTKRSSL